MVKHLLTVSVLLAIISTLIFTPGIAYAQTIVDSDIGTATGHEVPWQIKSFYAVGRHWIFFVDTTDDDLIFRSSADRGDTWTARTVLRANVALGEYFSVWFDGTFGYYAVCDFDADLQWRRFIPNADGTISTPTAEYEIYDNSSAFYPFVSVDSNGYPWVAGHKDVFKGATTDGTWVLDQSWIDESCADSTAIIPLTSGKMVLIYNGCPDPDRPMKAKRWTGSAWGSEVDSALECEHQWGWSAAAQDDDVHVAFLELTTYDITYLEWSYSTNDWGGAITLHSGALQSSFPEIQRNTANNDLFVYHEKHPSADHVYYHQYVNSETTWYVDYDWINDPDGLPTWGRYLNADYTCTTSTAGLYYIADPAILKYKPLDLPTEVETLSATAITEDAATIRGEIISLGSGTPVWRGFFWGTDPTLAIYDTIGEAGAFGVGVYSQTLTDLESDTIYYYKAYITDEYSNDFEGAIVSFMTAQPTYESEEEQQTGNNTLIPPLPDEPGGIGGWVGPPQDRGEFGIEGARIPFSFFLFLLLSALVVFLGIVITANAKSLGLLFLVLGFVVGFFCFYPSGGYLQWWVLLPYLVVGIALILREGQYSWS